MEYKLYILLLFYDDKIKMARKPKGNPVGHTGEGIRCKGYIREGKTRGVEFEGEVTLVRLAFIRFRNFKLKDLL